MCEKTVKCHCHDKACGIGTKNDHDAGDSHAHLDGSTPGNGGIHKMPEDIHPGKRHSESCAVYRIPNMDCPMEEQLIRKKLSTVPGIRGLQFNLMQRVLTVEHEPGDTRSIEDALRAIDMTPEPLGRVEKSEEPAKKIPWKKLSVAMFLAIFSEIFEIVLQWKPTESGHFSYYLLAYLPLVLAIVAIGLSGLDTYRKGWLAISNFNLNINALMSVAVTGAVLIGQFPEAAMVMVLFNISEALEAMALDRARNSIRELMALAPDVATIRCEDGTWRDVPSSEVPIGSVARVRPGQKIALDGRVSNGHSTVNQAPITGESMPVDKNPGDIVFAGTLNETGSFEFEVTARASDTTLARIIHSVEEAQGSRAPIQRFVDIFARYYTPGVFLLAICWGVLMPLLTGAGWSTSIYTALVILVIGCPCALVISTPVTVVSGMAAATRSGILVKGGLFLELGRRLNWLGLDKTGTLTSGVPRLTDFETCGKLAAEKTLELAASLADRSDHPVSRAIAEAGRLKDMKACIVTDFSAIPGQGICGWIEGEQWYLGNILLLHNEGLEIGKQQSEKSRELENLGKTVVFLASHSGVEGIFAVADTVRESSREAIHELRSLHVETVLLTGDNRHTAAAIAAEVGVDSFMAELLPDNKLQIIRDQEKSGKITGMAGDGINDAPALAQADIGFAMAANGTDTAMETADVALMDDDLRKIPRFIRLSKDTYAILVENIVLALGIKAIFFVLTFCGYASMWLAVFADVGASLLVVANGLRAAKK